MPDTLEILANVSKNPVRAKDGRFKECMCLYLIFRNPKHLNNRQNVF